MHELTELYNIFFFLKQKSKVINAKGVICLFADYDIFFNIKLEIRAYV